MPLAALHLYADGLSPPSMLFWRYVIAILALGAAAILAGLKLSQAWRDGAWRVVLLGATLGAGQTLCFWESIKTLETSVAVLLFYTYPALTVALDRLVFGHRVRPLALMCIGAILLGAALITAPGLHGGTLDPRGLAWALPAPLLYAVYLAINVRLLRRYKPLIGAAGLYIGMAATFGADGRLVRPACSDNARRLGVAAVHRARTRRGDDDACSPTACRVSARAASRSSPIPSWSSSFRSACWCSARR